jgi:catechol 2,3-dioxygenase-like lactoylglutathione lyase family enzyme
MKINFKRIDHVQVCIPFGEEERARAFYGKLLGLKEIPKPASVVKKGGMWFEIADIQLHIGVEEMDGPSKRHPAFEVDDVEGVRRYLESNGIKTRDEPLIEGLKRFSFYDPYGNRIELIEKLD